MADPNISKCQKENAKRVITRKDHNCLCCDKLIKKGVVAKVYYVNGLGRVLCHPWHKKDDIVLHVWDLLEIL